MSRPARATNARRIEVGDVFMFDDRDHQMGQIIRVEVVALIQHGDVQGVRIRPLFSGDTVWDQCECVPELLLPNETHFSGEDDY